MKTSGLVLGHESKKLCREDGIDRVSNLPENVIAHILSFLPTQDVVKTSALSTRWRYLWTSVGSLRFESPKGCRNKKTMSRFVNFVYKVLLLHESPVLQNFYLHCSNVVEVSCVDSWITAVLRRKKVINFDISYSEDEFMFPSCLFDCDSLETLKLDVPCKLRVPTQVAFSRLTTVELVRVNLLANSCSHLSLPSVQVLIFRSCVWYDLKMLTVVAPAMKRFSMLDPVLRRLLHNDVTTNLVSSDAVENCSLTISGQSLKDLEYSFTPDQVLMHLILPQPSRIVDATIVSSPTYAKPLDHMERVSLISSSLLKKFPFFQRLTLSGEIIEAFVQLSFSKELPTFEKLRELKVFWCSRYEALMKFLQGCPHLESLIFNETVEALESGLNLEVPWCVLLRLRFIRFECFRPWLDMNTAKFLLWQANALEEMHITFPPNQQNRTHLKKELCASPRGSSSAVLRFTLLSGRYFQTHLIRRN